MHLGEVGRDQKAKGLLEIRPQGPAVLDRRHDRAEVIVHQDHVGQIPRHLRATLAHGHADVGRLERGAVVDAVAGHRHDVAPGLERPHDLVLLGRRHPREHVDLAHDAAQGVGIQARELAGLEHAHLTLAQQAERPAHGHRRQSLVAGDHHRPDARLMADRDGRLHARAYGVDQSDQSDPRQGVPACRGVVIDDLEGESEDAHAFAGHPVVRPEDAASGGPVQLGVAVGAQPARRAAQDFLGRALDADEAPAPARVERSHPVSPLGAGRELDERSLRTKVGGIDATRPRRDEQRRLRRAAGDLERSVHIDGQRGLVAEHRHHERLGHGGIERTGRERFLRMVAAGDVPASHGHAVLGDRARLVHADDGRGSEALHRGQASHEHASLEHLSHAERQGRRRHRREPFRHRGDGEGRGGPEDRQRGEASQDPDEEQAAAQSQRGERELPARLVELTLERRARRSRLAHQRADAAQLRAPAGRRDDRLAGALRHDGSRVDHARAVADGDRRQRRGLQPLGHGRRLARERRLVGLESGDGDEAAVGGNVVPRSQQHDVAGHQVHPGQQRTRARRDGPAPPARRSR